MSSRDADYGAVQESCDSVEASRSTNASQTILLTEYGILLRTIEPLRIVNRTVLIGLSLLQYWFSPLLLSKQVLLQIVAALACCFWFLQEFVTSRKLGHLGELIAATSADEITAAAGRKQRAVVLPPSKNEPQTAQTPTAPSNWGSEDRDMPKSSVGRSWTDAYISWRLDAWKRRKILTLQRAEPIVWFVLILAVEVYRLLSLR
jgi:hypothetical protein